MQVKPKNLPLGINKLVLYMYVSFIHIKVVGNTYT